MHRPIGSEHRNTHTAQKEYVIVFLDLTDSKNMITQLQIACLGLKCVALYKKVSKARLKAVAVHFSRESLP